jgi:hypothetical protein
VFGLGPATRIYLAVGATDMRKGFDELKSDEILTLIHQNSKGNVFFVGAEKADCSRTASSAPRRFSNKPAKRSLVSVDVGIELNDISGAANILVRAQTALQFPVRFRIEKHLLGSVHKRTPY